MYLHLVKQINKKVPQNGAFTAFPSEKRNTVGIHKDVRKRVRHREQANMTDKELKKLRRGELLELLLEQSREIDRLSQKVKELEEQLDSRIMLMKASGSMAEEAMKLNRVFEAAQAAAQQYLENVKYFSSHPDIKEVIADADTRDGEGAASE